MTNIVDRSIGSAASVGSRESYVFSRNTNYMDSAIRRMSDVSGRSSSYAASMGRRRSNLFG